MAHSTNLSAHHRFVYRKSGIFACWPANGGIWHWRDEILVQFQIGTYAENSEREHSVARDKPIRKILARSLDGGKTWTHEEIIASHETSETHTKIDFTHPDFAM